MVHAERVARTSRQMHRRAGDKFCVRHHCSLRTSSNLMGAQLERAYLWEAHLEVRLAPRKLFGKVKASVCRVILLARQLATAREDGKDGLNVRGPRQNTVFEGDERRR